MAARPVESRSARRYPAADRSQIRLNTRRPGTPRANQPSFIHFTGVWLVQRTRPSEAAASDPSSQEALVRHFSKAYPPRSISCATYHALFVVVACHRLRHRHTRTECHKRDISPPKGILHSKRGHPSRNRRLDRVLGGPWRIPGLSVPIVEVGLVPMHGWIWFVERTRRAAWRV
jgi:hypothetical protein